VHKDMNADQFCPRPSLMKQLFGSPRDYML